MSKIQKWRRKEDGKEFKVLPWWECESELITATDAKKAVGDIEDDWSDRLYSVGVLVQVGWLLENEHGIWLGVGPQAKEHFEVIS